MFQTPPERVHQCFGDLSDIVRLHFSDSEEYRRFFVLELKPIGSGWLISIRTNLYPQKVFDLLRQMVDDINKEEELAFLLTLENPK